METQRVQMKGVFPWLVLWACRAGTRDFYPVLVALVGQVQKYFFITIHYFTSFVLIAQQAGQAVVLGHQSLNMCLCSEHYLSSFAQNICINSVFRCRQCCGSRYYESGYIDFSLNPTLTYQPPQTTDYSDQKLTTI